MDSKKFIFERFFQAVLLITEIIREDDISFTEIISFSLYSQPDIGRIVTFQNKL